MRTPQYQRPRSQSVHGRTSWVDATPDPVTGNREPALVVIDTGETYAVHPVGLTVAVGDVVALTWVGDTLLISGVIAHTPKESIPPAEEATA